MKELTLKEIQALSCEMLDEVHKFCAGKGIRYSLSYGSLIGAVRHGGFIPWDDDIDLVMPRPDFNLFCSTFTSDKGMRCLPPGGDSWLAFARVCDTARTRQRSFMPWSKADTGVWIDIFPLDGMPSDRQKFKTLADSASRIYQREIKIRSSLAHDTPDTSLLQKAKQAIKKVTRKGDIEKTVGTHIEMLERTGYEKATHVSQQACADNGTKEYFPKEWFEDVMLHDFEGRQFFITREYDKVLRACFGNYMQLPPEKDRTAHGGHTKFYWKKDLH